MTAINAAKRLAAKVVEATKTHIVAAINDATRKKFLLHLRKNSEFFSTWLYSKQGMFLVTKPVADAKTVMKNAKAALAALGWKLVKKEEETWFFLRNNEWLVSVAPTQGRVVLRIINDVNTLAKEVQKDNAGDKALAKYKKVTAKNLADDAWVKANQDAIYEAASTYLKVSLKKTPEPFRAAVIAIGEAIKNQAMIDY